MGIDESVVFVYVQFGNAIDGGTELAGLCGRVHIVSAHGLVVEAL